MSWELNYSEHPVWQAVRDALENVDQGADTWPDADRGDVARVRFVLAYLLDVGSTPEPLVSQASLEACRQAVVSLGAAVSSWRVDGEPSWLSDAAGSRTESVLDALRGWPVSLDKHTRSVISASRTFVQEAGREATRLQAQVGDLSAEVTALRQQLETDRAVSEQSVINAQQQVDAQVTRLDAALNGLQQTFAVAEAGRATAHTTAMAEQAKEAADQRTSIDTYLEEDRDKWESQAQMTLEHLVKQKESVDNLVNAVALTGVETSPLGQRQWTRRREGARGSHRRRQRPGQRRRRLRAVRVDARLALDPTVRVYWRVVRRRR